MKRRILAIADREVEKSDGGDPQEFQRVNARWQS